MIPQAHDHRNGQRRRRDPRRASAEDVAGFAVDLGEAGTLIDFGQGDSVLLHGVSYDDVAADPSRFFTVV